MIRRALSLLVIFLWASAVFAERRLNNLVVEVVNLSGSEAKRFRSLKFNQSADGWVYLSARARPRSEDRLFLFFDDETDADLGLTVTSSQPKSERQTYLSAG